LLIVLGRPIGIYEQEIYPFLKAELNLLRLRLAEQRKAHRICLNAQLIAAAAGSRVKI
jgi:GMP synthase (glutamine-hydrolysing)